MGERVWVEVYFLMVVLDADFRPPPAAVPGPARAALEARTRRALNATVTTRLEFFIGGLLPEPMQTVAASDVGHVQGQPTKRVGRRSGSVSHQQSSKRLGSRHRVARENVTIHVLHGAALSGYKIAARNDHPMFQPGDSCTLNERLFSGLDYDLKLSASVVKNRLDRPLAVRKLKQVIQLNKAEV